MPSRGKRSSLADQLASLDNPNPVDVDPENAENYVSDGSDEGSVDEDDDDGRSHYTAVGKSRLRDTESEKPTKAAYKGQKSSRKAIFETASDSEVEDDSPGSDSDGNEESGSEGDMAAFEDFDRAEGGFSDESAESSDESVSGSDSGSDQSNLSEDEESDDTGNNSEDEREAAEMKRLLADDQKAIVQDVVKTATADAEKGKAVKLQLGLYDSLLDTRIKLQKGLQSTNLASETGESTFSVAASAETETAALDFIETLFTLRDDLMEQDLSKNAPSRKRKFNDGALVSSSDLWDAIQTQDNGLTAWRDQTLTKWSNKINAASGIDKTKKFKALSQGILAQIEESKSDRAKLSKRTQIKRYKASAKTTVSVEDFSPEIFDDGDFYQEMLKDLIDSRMLDSSNGNQMKWIATKQPKQKKGQVDTRASKGRKLRYHVHEKIQNFMAPIPTGNWHEEQVDELFGSLFGQTLQVNDENAEDDTMKNDVTVEAVEIGDDFKLFG